MVKTYILIFAILFVPIFTRAQVDPGIIEGPFHGEYTQEAGPCLSKTDRALIQDRLDQNSKLLKEEGKLKVFSNAIVSFDWPVQQASGFDYNAIFGISNFVDHDSNFPNMLKDYNCGERTYDLESGYNHQGLDIFLWPFSWHMVNNEQAEVVAAAAGTIIGKDDGNADTNCDFSNPDWNAVYVQHSDGSTAWYGHMKNGSLTSKAIGATVVQGEYLGIVASSGSSTGPHLHFEVYDNGSNLIDPYYLSGACNGMNTSSWWTSQKDYYDSQVNTVLIHTAPPVFNTCPAPATTNISECYLPGDQVFFAAYYHDQLAGQVSAYTVYRPDGSVYSSWTHSSSTAHFSASYWYWFTTLPLSANIGTWTFEVTFEGETISREFHVQVTCVLPVELHSFQVQKLENRIAHLEWFTASEEGNSGFSIERSQNAKKWENIGWIDGFGTSLTELSYQFNDCAPKTGVNYYRLKQLDEKGSFSYSEIRSVQFDAGVIGIRVFPNPVEDQLNLEIGDTEKLDGEIAIYNASGELVYLAMPDKHFLLVSQLNPGVYFLETRIGKQRIVKRFIRL